MSEPFRIATFWPNLDTISRWVADRGVNALVYPSDWISHDKPKKPEEWDQLHQKVSMLRRSGYPNLRVIRRPWWMIGHENEFDVRWRDHLLAYCLDDEIEDKAKGPDGKRLEWTDTTGVTAYALNQINDYRTRSPDVPIFAMFNGLHLQGSPKPAIRKMYEDIAAKCDIIAADAYTGTQRQIRHKDGSLRYPLSGHWTCTDLLREWTGKPVWGVLETADQKLRREGEDASRDADSPGAKWLASRPPTMAEAEEIVGNFPDGLVYFPLGKKKYTDKNMNVNDGTTPELAEWMPRFAARKNPQHPPPGEVFQPPPTVTLTFPPNRGPYDYRLVR